jgi:hypothetical protein
MHATSNNKTNMATHQPRSSFMQKFSMAGKKVTPSTTDFMQKFSMGSKKVTPSTTDPSLEMGCESSGIIKEKELSLEEEDSYFFRLESGELGSKERPLTPKQSLFPTEQKQMGSAGSEDDFLWSDPTRS